MEYFPLFHKLDNKQCLIVGGGAVAARKIRLLLKTQVQLNLVSPQLHHETEELLIQTKHMQHQAREFQPHDLDKVVLVFACTADKSLNAEVARLCGEKNIPVNVVDQPELCTVITPAIVDRAPILVAISSSSAAPVLARSIRQQIEKLLPPNLGRFASLLSGFRKAMAAKISDSKQRLRLWQQIVDGPAKELQLVGREDEARELIHQTIDKGVSAHVQGEVYLVGAGPGDPELLTLKALRLMQQADVVLYDRLVSDGIMELVRRDADRIYVGKQRSDHSVPQEDINLQLARLAQEGKRVLRLKGGDPFIFGRGGEELETLAEQGVSFQVVPGITAASGCASYAGIPLTHRDHAQSVRFITGHLKSDKTNLRWPELAAGDQTLVFYMGLVGLPMICQSLIEAGRIGTTPAAIIEKGTTTQQRVIKGDLHTLPELVKSEAVRAPTLLIIGGVVSLYPSLSWFQK